LGSLVFMSLSLGNFKLFALTLMNLMYKYFENNKKMEYFPKKCCCFLGWLLFSRVWVDLFGYVLIWCKKFAFFTERSFDAEFLHLFSLNALLMQEVSIFFHWTLFWCRIFASFFTELSFDPEFLHLFSLNALLMQKVRIFIHWTLFRSRTF